MEIRMNKWMNRDSYTEHIIYSQGKVKFYPCLVSLKYEDMETYGGMVV
jgi:hypothetical protein